MGMFDIPSLFPSFENSLNRPEKTEKQEEILQMLTTRQPVEQASWFTKIKMQMPKKESRQERIQKIPLAERTMLLMDEDAYQYMFEDLIRSKIKAIKQDKIERLKKEDPELAKQATMKNVVLSADAEDELMTQMAEVFIKTLFTKEEIKQATLNLLDPKAHFRREDRDVLKICMYAWKHDLEHTAEAFGVKKGFFQSCIAKKETELADMMGKALENDPRSIICYGTECCKGIKGFNRGEMALTADRWVSRWLNPRLLRILSQALVLKPVSEKPDKADRKRTEKYQADFKTCLIYYFYKSPTKAQKVFQMAVPYLENMDVPVQEQLWGILFEKYKKDPDILKDVVGHISAFLEKAPNPKARHVLYSTFIKVVPPNLRAQILGQMPIKTLRRYWQSFREKYESMIYAPVQNEQGSTFLAWHLFHQGELSDTQMVEILKKATLKRRNEFLFSEKKQMDSGVFSTMCGVFADSQFHFWKWVRSFKNIDGFKGRLADMYPLLSNAVRENKHYVHAMNNHFQLIRECAIKGDTASLSFLKNVLGRDVVWRSLTQCEKGEISGVRSLCRQGKRGLLKLMAGLPPAEQQRIFQTVDETGRTLLDDCPSGFARKVSEEVFKHVYVKPAAPEEPVPQKELALEPKSSDSVSAEPVKPVVSREIIKIPVFESHLSRITDQKLLKEVEETMSSLATMSKLEIQAELREGWKNHGSLEKAPCVVKDIRGKKYRLGYLLSGNTDLGTGKIAFLFFLSHAQYNVFLNKQADQAVKVATNLMSNIPPDGLEGRGSRV